MKSIPSETGYVSGGFVMAPNSNYLSISRYSYSSEAGLENANYSNNSQPVTLFGIVSEAKNISGKVTDENGDALKGVEVVLGSGSVEYSAVTKEDGKYSIDILKSGLSFEMKVTKANYNPFVQKDVVIEEENLVKDIVLAEAKSLFINSVSVPTTATVNTSITATASINNPFGMKVEAADYQARLVVEDAEGNIAETDAATVAIASMDDAELTFSYMPHVVGLHKAHVEIVYGEENSVSETHEFTVKEEELGGIYQVLDSAALSAAGPIQTGSYKNETQTIYTSEQLRLPAGSVIKGLQYRGYVATAYSGPVNTTTHVKVWLENTDMPTGYTSDEYNDVAFDITASEPAYEADVTFVTKGANDSTFVMLDIPLNFSYEGKNLRIVMYQQLLPESTSSSYIYWMVNGTVKQTYSRSAWSESQALGSWTTYNNAPVVFINAVSRADIVGTVTNGKNMPVEGAEVKAQSGDVFYTATTDNEGKYAITIAQLDKDYTLTVNAPTYQEAVVDDVNIEPNGTEVIDVQLHTVAPLSGTVTDAETGEAIAATITVTNADGETVATAETDADGRYTVDVVDAEGDYVLRATADGYAEKDETLTIGIEALTLDIAMLKSRNTLSGTVSVVDKPYGEARPYAGATVVLMAADGNQLVATTDNEGHYAIEVVRPNGNYTASYSAAGYVGEDKELVFADEDVTLDVTLYSAEATSIDELIMQGKTRAAVYTSNGVFLGSDVDLRGLRRGVYIINGNKYVVK